MLVRVGTIRCIGKGVNTEVCWEGWEHCGVKGRVGTLWGVFGRVGTLRCVRKGGNTEVCWK